MSKRIICLCLFTVLFAAMSACGSENNMNTQQMSSAEESFVFSYKGLDICVNDDVSAIVASLGEPADYFEAPSCAFEGLDKLYSYNDVEIDTYPDGDVDRISAIILNSDLVETKEGICIGDDVSLVKEKYGNDFKESTGLISYESGESELRFLIREEIVISIEYRTTRKIQ